jgi:hypothetical protein
MTRKTGGLTPDFVESFFKDLGCSAGEVRQRADSEAHRRFLLLSGGTIHLGPSFNYLDKSEVATSRPGDEDRKFFDDEWARAKKIYPTQPAP